MEYGSQKAAIRLLNLVLGLMVLTPSGAQDLRWDVRHERMLRDRAGVLAMDEHGVTYVEKDTTTRWDYQDIQQLWISTRKIVIVTYTDRLWLLGIDKEFEFYLTSEGQTFEPAYKRLKDKLDQRFVAALADSRPDLLWQIPVKLQGVIRGSEGVLQMGPERIVYKTDREGTSRTWRYGDIENISTSGPFQLTLTTYERANAHYGSLKGFNFQLKQRLDEKRFDLLWKRLNRDKGLRFLAPIAE